MLVGKGVYMKDLDELDDLNIMELIALPCVVDCIRLKEDIKKHIHYDKTVLNGITNYVPCEYLGKEYEVCVFGNDKYPKDLQMIHGVLKQVKPELVKFIDETEYGLVSDILLRDGFSGLAQVKTGSDVGIHINWVCIDDDIGKVYDAAVYESGVNYVISDIKSVRDTLNLQISDIDTRRAAAILKDQPIFDRYKTMVGQFDRDIRLPQMLAHDPNEFVELGS